MRSLKAARHGFKSAWWLWNLTAESEVQLPSYKSNFRATQKYENRISRLRDSTRSYDKMSYLLVNIGPGLEGSHGQVAANMSISYVNISVMVLYFCCSECLPRICIWNAIIRLSHTLIKAQFLRCKYFKPRSNIHMYTCAITFCEAWYCFIYELIFPKSKLYVSERLTPGRNNNL